ncbi:LacI family transcriptional regulator [Deinococcus roseus]|uniref:LacI family transcriptional regulator n=2 Tax=Deinococcus roseus TaxID=392414 RepID=A0ABQ2D2S1_9DEIO|nr:LacI family transcriptional regulator [Deinococcus roseus]
MVSQDTRDRILAVAHQLGYQAIQQARLVKQQASTSIALLVTDLENPFYATLAKGVQAVADQHGCNVLLYDTEEDELKEERFLKVAMQQKIQGLLIVPTKGTLNHLKELAEVPVVELDCASGFSGVGQVLAENVRGTVLAMDHLISLGHKKIGFIGGPPDMSSTAERLEGYQQALALAGLLRDPRWITYGYGLESGAAEVTRKLMALPKEPRPTALFVGNADMMIGTLTALQDLKLKVPQDVSVVGFDDPPWAKILQPPLTVVAQSPYEMGRVACGILMQNLQREFVLPPLNIRLPTQLIVRGSTERLR